jgi:hypothetical protein
MIVLAFARRTVEDTKILELPLSHGVQAGSSQVVCLERLVPQFLSNCEPWAFENFHFRRIFGKRWAIISTTCLARREHTIVCYN